MDNAVFRNCRIQITQSVAEKFKFLTKEKKLNMRQVLGVFNILDKINIKDTLVKKKKCYPLFWC